MSAHDPFNRIVYRYICICNFSHMKFTHMKFTHMELEPFHIWNLHMKITHMELEPSHIWNFHIWISHTWNLHIWNCNLFIYEIDMKICEISQMTSTSENLHNIKFGHSIKIQLMEMCDNSSTEISTRPCSLNFWVFSKHQNGVNSLQLCGHAFLCPEFNTP